MTKCFTRPAALLLFLGAVFSCNNLDDLEQRIDSLESRIQALETQLPALNENVAAISALVADGVLINNVEETENGYTITTSDGREFTLTNGAVGNTPQISVNENGNWIVSYDNGSSWNEITVDGAPVSATGAAPKFGVDADGCWQVSYDGGQSWTSVLDPEGEKVPATGEGSAFFQDIQYDGDTFTVTLADGTKLEIAVVPDFLCKINGVDYSTAVLFGYGDSKSYSVSIKGVAEAFVTAPSGWTAVLDGTEPAATLTVTAPQSSAAGTAVQTKVSADTRTDISILAVSSKGLSAITKMKVGLSAEPVPANPAASVTANNDAATSSSLSFTVTPNGDVTTWRYLLLTATENAPERAAFESAQDQTGTQTLVLDKTADGTSLSASTEYVLYVLPYNSDDEVYGAIASAKSTTAMPSYDTYYEMYEAGLDITIAGRTYNKATYGEAVLVTSSNADITSVTTGETAGTAVYFIEPDADAVYHTTSAVVKLILIGNDPDQQSPLNVASQINLNQGDASDGTFLCMNLDVDATNTVNSGSSATYPIAQNGNNAFGYAGVFGCKILTRDGQPLTYISSNNRSYAEFVMEDCDYRFNSVSTNNNKFVISVSSSTARYASITFRNNVFYCTTSEQNFKLFNGSNATIGNLVMENNSFINLDTNTTYTVYAGTVENVSVTKNLFRNNSVTANGNGFIRATNNPSGTTCTDNIAWCNVAFKMFFTNQDWATEVTTIDEDPFTGGTLDFENGIFTPTANYSQYGAQRD